jgi:hypothetical protein
LNVGTLVASPFVSWFGVPAEVQANADRLAFLEGGKVEESRYCIPLNTGRYSALLTVRQDTLEETPIPSVLEPERELTEIRVKVLA